MQWDYRVLRCATSTDDACKELETKLNVLGTEGYEAITAVQEQNSLIVLLKREKPVKERIGKMAGRITQ